MNKLKQYLAEKKISQYKLAGLIGMKRCYVTTIISKNLDVRVSTAKKMAEALNCKIEDIF